MSGAVRLTRKTFVDRAAAAQRLDFQREPDRVHVPTVTRFCFCALVCLQRCSLHSVLRVDRFPYISVRSHRRQHLSHVTHQIIFDFAVVNYQGCLRFRDRPATIAILTGLVGAEPGPACRRYVPPQWISVNVTVRCQTHQRFRRLRFDPEPSIRNNGCRACQTLIRHPSTQFELPDGPSAFDLQPPPSHPCTREVNQRVPASDTGSDRVPIVDEVSRTSPTLHRQQPVRDTSFFGGASVVNTLILWPVSNRLIKPTLHDLVSMQLLQPSVDQFDGTVTCAGGPAMLELYAGPCYG